MSRILFINSVCYGSTGTICKNLYKAAEEAGHTCCIAYGRGDAPEGFNTIKIGNQLDIYFHVLKARIFDAMGFGSIGATKRFIKEIERFKPDIIHMHNIHGYYLNLEILFSYLKKHPNIKKIWTLHDCWAFTGHCPHYQYEKCTQWQIECKHCVRKYGYPKSILDNCNYNYKVKKKLFTDIDNMILVTPSLWLKNEVKKSYLQNYITKVINNGIDPETFKPTSSDIKKKYGIQSKRIILGVASVWDNRKGLDTFISLSKVIDKEYIIVLIGLSTSQIKKMPSNIIGITRTENVEELVMWYSAAYVYVNASLEETFGMTTVEAINCGVPVIVLDGTALPEVVGDKGIVLHTDDVLSIYQSIKDIENNKFPYTKCYLINDFFNSYLKLYEVK